MLYLFNRHAGGGNRSISKIKTFYPLNLRIIMSKMKCGWCSKPINRSPVWFRRMNIHKACQKDILEWEKTACVFCKIKFTGMYPEYRKTKMHKNCWEQQKRIKNSIRRTYSGGTGSKK